MGASGKMMVSMSEELYARMPNEFREQFYSTKLVFDDYNIYKDDPDFQKLYKAKKKASKLLDDYKFNKRHNKI